MESMSQSKKGQLVEFLLLPASIEVARTATWQLLVATFEDEQWQLLIGHLMISHSNCHSKTQARFALTLQSIFTSLTKC